MRIEKGGEGTEEGRHEIWEIDTHSCGDRGYNAYFTSSRQVEWDQVMRKIYIHILICLCIYPLEGFGADYDLRSDTWVATDALKRRLPTHTECIPLRKNRYVGIFYWTWHTRHGVQGPFDNTKIITANPTNPQWGPETAAHHWGEPELGYYISTDPYVIRKHASMLTDAGIDVIIFDTTNPPFTFKESYMALCREFRNMREEGNRTPQIAFLAPFWNPKEVVKTVYNDLYKPGLYKELWFIWKGKPLIMADPQQIEDEEIKGVFTFRKPIPSYFTGPSGPDQWGWLEIFPQHGFHNSKNEIEQVTVGIAQNAVGNKLSAMSHKDGARGRSWHNSSKDNRPQAVNYGLNFTEQWKRALELDPEFIFITGWNEWVAGRFTKWYKYTGKDSYYPDALFVDQYNHEYSRDIEPMKGGHTDSYYYQMVSYIRKFKGVRKPQFAAIQKTMVIDGDFSDWSEVVPEYRDTIGDTLHRNHKGYGTTHYTNTTGRNDVVLSKVTNDEDNIYFFVQTRADISPHTDSNWMLLFIDVDQRLETGWCGYDYLINRKVIDAETTNLEHTEQGWNWKTKAKVRYKVKNNQMEIKVPCLVLGYSEEDRTRFDFHWSDNIQDANSIIEFAVSGDSAPNRRFNYRYESSN